MTRVFARGKSRDAAKPVADAGQESAKLLGSLN
jgi:hypothetical protein